MAAAAAAAPPPTPREPPKRLFSTKVMELRNTYTSPWHVGMCSVCTADCPFCCFAMLCPSWASFILRKRVLNGDLTKYECCGGFTYCSGKCKEADCPAFCLCQEVFWCLPGSVATTRFMLQDSLRLQNTKCDNCLITCAACVQACLCSCLVGCCIGAITGSSDVQMGQGGGDCDCCMELAYLSICACMQTQHKVQLDLRDGKLGPTTVHPMSAPGPQAMK